MDNAPARSYSVNYDRMLNTIVVAICLLHALPEIKPVVQRAVDWYTAPTELSRLLASNSHELEARVLAFRATIPTHP